MREARDGVADAVAVAVDGVVAVDSVAVEVVVGGVRRVWSGYPLRSWKR
jgi:hypothetical protein